VSYSSDRLPIVVLGSTGSVGQQTLDIVRRNPDRFVVKGLAAFSQVQIIAEQVKEFKPEVVALADVNAAHELRSEVSSDCQVLKGEDGVLSVATINSAFAVVGAMVGFSGLKSVVAALDAGKHVALANKETLVAAGPLVLKKAKDRGVRIIPVDSEHSSIYQCLGGDNPSTNVKQLIITASGGPFWQMCPEEFPFITPEQAVNHPRWNMGPKISVDSATMFNKGLEVIEACRLFNVSADQIGVVIHPQSIVHGMVEMQDGSIIAALSSTDMRLPIGFALGELEQLAGFKGDNDLLPDNGASRLSLAEVGKLEFFEPDNTRFPALSLGFEALKNGDSMPIVYNAANEVAVDLFLQKGIKFLDIASVVSQTMAEHHCFSPSSVEQIEDTDLWARKTAMQACAGLSS
jgi:1-deoxy-D-xylulose-5-phosphate reductoisomerase